MTPERWQRVKKLFEAALNQDRTARESFLSAAAADDPSLAEEVCQLLASDEKAGTFLRAPPQIILTEPDRPPDEQATTTSVPRVFAGRYQVICELGRGGMGHVVRARDLKIGREVAIKLLAPGPHTEEQRLRFEQEARAAGALNHPNILAVHDIGEQGSEPFIVTELLEGETLRSVLSRAPLLPERALDVAIQLAEGLAAAHAAGIVHRDIKPENLFLTRQGHLKILDFGIAKLLEGTQAAGAPRTGTGMVMGTPGYMSPEQVRGDHATARSDVFAFGAVLQEMLSGKGPFERHTAVDSAHAILHDPPGPLPPSTPDALARLIARCLQKEAAARPFDGSEVLADLRKISLPPPRRSRPLWLAAPLAVLAAVAIFALWPRSKPVSVPPSVAVLPFTDLSPNKDQEYFSDGIAEEILDLLAKVPGLRVAARTSAFAFKGKNEDIGAIAGKLHVGTILEGSVRKAGDRIRITTQLINASDGYHLWSETYDRKLTDIFAVQDEIGQAVVAALKLKLLQATTPKERRAVSTEAYNQYLLGRQFYHRNNPDDFRRAQQAFERVVMLDPGYAPAWAGLAMATFWVAQSEESLSAVIAGHDRAVVAANKAVALAPELPDGYLARGFVRTVAQWNFDGSRADFEHALALNPDDAFTLTNYAYFVLRPVGRLSEGVAASRRAAELDPLNARVWFTLGMLLYLSGENGAARDALNRSLEISPVQSYTPHALGLTFIVEAKPAMAKEAFQRCSAGHLRIQGAALAEHDLGHLAEGQRALEELIEKFGHSAAYQIAQVYAWRGEKDRAFDWFERARAQHDAGLILVKVDRLLVKLHGDPRYTAILKKMNLPLD